MANLENKKTISAYQLALIIVSTSFGGQVVLGMRDLIDKAEQGTWLSIIAGGIIYGGMAWLMFMLGKKFPEESLAEYLPRVWGRWGGGAILLWLNLSMFLQIVTIITGASRAIALFMFDLTPIKILGLGMWIVMVYWALQDFGTILRVVQITFFLQTAFMVPLWALTTLNFSVDNLLPLLPSDWFRVAGGAVSTYSLFSGYEVLLLLLPLLGQTRHRFGQGLGYAFLYLTAAFLWLAVIIIGVMTVQGAKNTPYPTIIAIRAVELPGTFVERLENYLILAWIPAVIDTLALILFMKAKFFAQFFQHRDHRPWVLLLAGLAYIVFDFIDNIKAYELAGQVAVGLGIGFSGLAIPATLAMHWWQKRRGYG